MCLRQELEGATCIGRNRADAATVEVAISAHATLRGAMTVRRRRPREVRYVSWTRAPARDPSARRLRSVHAAGTSSRNVSRHAPGAAPRTVVDSEDEHRDHQVLGRLREEGSPARVPEPV